MILVKVWSLWLSRYAGDYGTLGGAAPQSSDLADLRGDPGPWGDLPLHERPHCHPPEDYCRSLPRSEEGEQVQCVFHNGSVISYGGGLGNI